MKKELQNDEKLVKLSREFVDNRNNNKIQSDICDEISSHIYHKQYKKYHYFKNIIYEKNITHNDLINWLQIWEPEEFNNSSL